MGVNIFEGTKANRVADALETISTVVENLISPEIAEESAIVNEAKRWATGKDLSGHDVPDTAEQYENNALFYADQAKQCAATAGYLKFYINNNGELIYQHTRNVGLQFELRNGELIMICPAQ